MNTSSWARATRAAMARNEVTLTSLGRELGVNYETVRNWLRTPPRASPDLSQLTRIASCVGMHPLEPLMLLGVVPEGLAQMATENAALRQRVDHLTMALGARAECPSTLSRLLDAVLRTGRFGMAVWPVGGGPSSTDQVHVGDHVQIVAVDQAAVHDGTRLSDLVAADPDAGSSIAECMADIHVAGTTPEFPIAEALRGPDSAGNVARYVVPRFSADRLPAEDAHRLAVPREAILVLGVLESTWVTTIAAIVARGLGWGLHGTGSLRHTVFGPSVSAGAASSAWTMNRERNMLLRDILAHPPRQFVLHHRGLPVSDRVAEASGSESASDPHGLLAYLEEGAPVPFVALLSESDACIEEVVAARHRQGRPVSWSVGTVVKLRDDLRSATSELAMEGRALIVPVDSIASGQELSDSELDQRRWVRGATASNAIIDHLIDRFSVEDEPFVSRDTEAGVILASGVHSHGRAKEHD